MKYFSTISTSIPRNIGEEELVDCVGKLVSINAIVFTEYKNQHYFTPTTSTENINF